MTRASHSQTVLVADAQTNTALCVARSLARGGYRVVAMGTSLAGAVKSSAVTRWECVTCDDEGQYLEQVLSLARRERAVAICAHYETTLLGLRRRLREERPVVVGAGLEQIESCARKSNVLDAARRAGVPVPRTLLATSQTTQAELHSMVGALVERHGWPLFAKADSEIGIPPGLDSRYVVIRRGQDLPRLSEFLRSRGRVLLQERVVGTGCGIAGLFLKGVPARFGGHIRLREAHASGGVSTYCESRIVPDALRSASMLLKELNWTGVAMVEFKIRPDGPPVLMEVNPRLWGSLPLYVHAGADVPLAALEYALEGKAPEPRPFVEGRRMRFLLSDLAAIRRQCKGIRKVGELALVVATTPWLIPDATFSVQDPLPFLIELIDQASRRLGRLRFRPGRPMRASR